MPGGLVQLQEKPLPLLPTPPTINLSYIDILE